MALTIAASAAADDLRVRMGGTVLAASDADYDNARRVWNGAVDRSPALIARCADERDVSLAVRVAREHGLPLSVRGGGHDWAGRAVRDGGLVVDLSGMRRAIPHPDTATADVQGGTRAGDLVAATNPYGLVPVTGTVKAVGLTGLTLAGGYGLLAGRHGLALDNLVAARVVLADGTAVTTDAERNPDLFWALRGGGGNFGVVTDARYRVHPIRTLVSGLLLFPLEQATQVLTGYRELIAHAPDELTVMAGFFCGEDGKPMLFLLPAWCGREAAAQPDTARLTGLGTPIMSDVTSRSYQDTLGLFDASIVNGRYNEMRTCWLAELTPAAIDSIVGAAERITSPLSGLFLHHFHGAAGRVPVADTAFALRTDHLLVEIVGAWLPGVGDDGVVHQHWARSLAAELAGAALPGGYANLLGPDETGRALRGYGPNADRLLALKRRFDPDHVFSAVPTLPDRLPDRTT
ncbi:MAG TPA: FAD-binding oxidoreductase [Pseudonocardiaceae bacterium]|nr:FAD-binding oxidoreductase [Pseudonocardiaceae bacterium]